ncbi:MAG: hypothetical protein WDA59_07900 [Methanofastidiosum sp.]|jgi:hypothetical protein
MGMTRKGAQQLAAHIQHAAPKVRTQIYRSFPDHKGFGVQVSYGNKPDYVSCLYPSDWKESKQSVLDSIK